MLTREAGRAERAEHAKRAESLTPATDRRIRSNSETCNDPLALTLAAGGKHRASTGWSRLAVRTMPRARRKPRPTRPAVSSKRNRRSSLPSALTKTTRIRTRNAAWRTSRSVAPSSPSCTETTSSINATRRPQNRITRCKATRCASERKPPQPPASSSWTVPVRTSPARRGSWQRREPCCRSHGGRNRLRV